MVAPLPSSTLRPLRVGRRSLRWLAVPVAGMLGSIALYVTYLRLAPQLPGTIASHYSASGVPNAWMPVGSFVRTAIVVLLVNAGIVAGILYAIGRSDVVEERFGRVLLGPVSGCLAFLFGVSLPGLFIALLLQAAGSWPASLPAPLAVGTLLILLPMVVLVGVAFRGARQLPPLDVPMAGGRIIGAEGRTGPVFQCSSCGEQFVRSAWVMLGPRVGYSAGRGGAAYYLTCPVCGERGWDTRVGWRRAPPNP